MTSYPVNMTLVPEVKGFFDPDTNTISYVVRDPGSTSCAVIDSVMDIDYAAGRITYGHADQIIAHIRDNGLKLEWLHRAVDLGDPGAHQDRDQAVPVRVIGPDLRVHQARPHHEVDLRSH